MSRAYYNEHDPFAAGWLRELIKAGHIAPGDVDERDIRDVTPADVRGYTQAHFFAGVGVWSYALRAAGWSDGEPVWSGSCPCQPFSTAGRGEGMADERHLWPAFFHLLEICRPPVVFGEQVASKDGLQWLDLVSADLEGTGYAFGAADLCAAGVGAPHIRQRLYFVAHTGNAERTGRGYAKPRAGLLLHAPDCGAARSLAHALPAGRAEGRPVPGERPATGSGLAGGTVGDTSGAGLEGRPAGPMGDERTPAKRAGSFSGMAHSQRGGCRESGKPGMGRPLGDGRDDSHLPAATPDPGPTNGFWSGAEWLPCRDGKLRPVEPGTFPLAHGAPARVGRLRGYGNAIVAPLAAEFVAACREVLHA